MDNQYKGQERRGFVRLDYVTPLAYKVCKKETILKLFAGYTVNISQSGLLCKIKERVEPGDILWLSFDRATLSICEEIERNCFIYQNGIIGKVVRVGALGDSFHIGLRFIIRQEKNLTYIYPKIHFLKELPPQHFSQQPQDDEIDQ